jgi:hypothetical protein
MRQVEIPGNPVGPEEPVQGIKLEAALARSRIGNDPKVAGPGVLSDWLQIFRHMNLFFDGAEARRFSFLRFG